VTCYLLPLYCCLGWKKNLRQFIRHKQIKFSGGYKILYSFSWQEGCIIEKVECCFLISLTEDINNNCLYSASSLIFCLSDLAGFLIQFIANMINYKQIVEKTGTCI
jgi:hypothetical protein